MKKTYNRNIRAKKSDNRICSEIIEMSANLFYIMLFDYFSDKYNVFDETVWIYTVAPSFLSSSIQFLALVESALCGKR
jgi:hypothetical protein